MILFSMSDLTPRVHDSNYFLYLEFIHHLFVLLNIIRELFSMSDLTPRVHDSNYFLYLEFIHHLFVLLNIIRDVGILIKSGFINFHFRYHTTYVG